MIWNEHLDIEGQHAFLSASNHHWLNYSNEKLIAVYKNLKSKEEGTWLHNFASMAIQKKIKLAKNKQTLNLFVNDSIGFNMTSEQMLQYSNNSFGTADAISFKDNVLKIFDFKSGSIKASFRQLDIYAALFCLEYNVNPYSVIFQSRIYQSNSYIEVYQEPVYIDSIMKIIVEFDNLLEVVKNDI